MNNKTKMTGVILTNDSNFAYKLRTKLKLMGIEADYTSYLVGLLDYLIDKQEGIVFVRSKSERCRNYIYKYSSLQNIKNFVFVFIVDDDKESIECDNVLTYKCTYKNLENLIPKIIVSMKNKIHCSDKIPLSSIEEYTIRIFNSLRFPINLRGSNYIKDCVQILFSQTDSKKLTLTEVYKIISERYNITIANIEKSIRLSITKMFEESGMVAKCVFAKDKISNSEFINYIINSIKTMHCQRIKSI